MSHSLKLQFETLENLKLQRIYTIDCLINRIDEMEDSEVKEFINLKKEYDNEIEFLNDHLKSVA